MQSSLSGVELFDDVVNVVVESATVLNHIIDRVRVLDYDRGNVCACFLEVISEHVDFDRVRVTGESKRLEHVRVDCGVVGVRDNYVG